MRIAGTIWHSRYLWCRILPVIFLVFRTKWSYSAFRQGAGPILHFAILSISGVVRGWDQAGPHSQVSEGLIGWKAGKGLPSE